MRHLIMPLFAAALLLGTTARPAHAEDWLKRYADCIKFAATWHEIALEESNNFLEDWAIEVGYTYLLIRCHIDPDMR